MSNNISTQTPLSSNQQQQPVANGTNGHADQNTRAPYRHSKTVRFMECLKNHSTATGGHTTDGCGEFLAGGPEGTIEALICCVCNCHRNFHRQVIIHPCSNPFCCQPPVSARAQQVMAANQVEEGSVAPKKRFRTKFTPEQKEKLNIFAEKSGWKIPKLGDPEVNRICQEIGIGRQVLKVWMHNNKYHPNKKP